MIVYLRDLYKLGIEGEVIAQRLERKKSNLIGNNCRHYTLISIALNCQNQSNSSSDVYSLGLVDMPESREVAEYLFSNLIPELKSVQESSLQKILISEQISIDCLLKIRTQS